MRDNDPVKLFAIMDKGGNCFGISKNQDHTQRVLTGYGKTMIERRGLHMAEYTLTPQNNPNDIPLVCNCNRHTPGVCPVHLSTHS